MANINFSFNGTDYVIDESTLSAATADLKTHLSTVMNGSGATITLDGVTYNIDAAKLSAVEDNFASYLSQISGEPTESERLEGDGSEYYTLAPTALSFRSTAPLNELKEVQINGVAVDPANYTLEEGSTIVTFPIEYLKTLPVGNYEVTVASDSKAVKGDFIVKAPKLNEHGFYYNQPYAAYVGYFGSYVAFFIREDGTLDALVLPNATETCTYTVSGNSMTVASASMGELHLTFSEDGTEAYNTEIDITFNLGDERVVADEEYIYILSSGGYMVTTIDRNKSEYDAIKAGVNGLDVEKLANQAFYENNNLIIAPVMPDTISHIGNNCFDSCTNLTSVSLPRPINNSLYINGYAFSNTALEEIVIPNPNCDNSNTFIENRAFSECKNLRKVTFGDSVIIRTGAFCDCVNLNTIVYEGTMAQWNAVIKANDWNYNVPATHVQCIDGTVAL